MGGKPSNLCPVNTSYLIERGSIAITFPFWRHSNLKDWLYFFTCFFYLLLPKFPLSCAGAHLFFESCSAVFIFYAQWACSPFFFLFHFIKESHLKMAKIQISRKKSKIKGGQIFFWNLPLTFKRQNFEFKPMHRTPPPLHTFIYILNIFAHIYFCTAQSAKKLEGTLIVTLLVYNNCKNSSTYKKYRVF